MGRHAYILALLVLTTVFLSGTTLISNRAANAANINELIIDTPDEPTYPSCLDAQGQIKVVHYNGKHGIPGDSKEYYGTDQVNILSNSTLVQCYCPDKGSEGVQTNWWQADDMSESEIETLIKMGWVYIPNGKAWGLNEGAYLAKNTPYACKGTGGPEDPKDRDSKDDPNDKHDAPKTKVSGDVLGLMYLPFTGNEPYIAGFFILGTASLGLAVFTLKFGKSK